MREDRVKMTFNQCNVATLLGIEVTEVRDGFAKGRLPVRKEHLNVFGDLHGGIAFALADHIAGACSNTQSGRAVLLESSIHYVRGGSEGKTIWAESVLTHCGKKIGRVDTRIFDEDGAVVALAHQIFYVKEDEYTGTAAQDI